MTNRSFSGDDPETRAELAAYSRRLFAPYKRADVPEPRPEGSAPPNIDATTIMRRFVARIFANAQNDN